MMSTLTWPMIRKRSKLVQNQIPAKTLVMSSHPNILHQSHVLIIAYLVTGTSNRFVSICVFVCMCLSRVSVCWLFVLLTNRWLCLFSLVKFQTCKSHPTTTAWKHRDTKKDWDREIEKTNILWMFVFVFSASFVLVEYTSLLLQLLSCSSNNELHSWPLLLLLHCF